MKYLFLSIWFLPAIAFGGFENYRAIGAEGAVTTYASKAKCVKKEKAKKDYQGCFKILGKEIETHKVVEVEDETQPIYRDPKDSKVQIGCDDQKDCAQKMYVFNEKGEAIENVCAADGGTPKYDKTDSWLSIVGLASEYFIWCESVIGYGTKKVYMEDPDLKSVYDAKQAEILAENVLVKEGSKARKFGEQMINYLVGYIKRKKLPKASRKQLNKDFKTIIDALEIGSIDIAQELIAALPEDGVVVTAKIKKRIDKKFVNAGY